MRKSTAFIRGRRLIIFLLVPAAFIRGRRLFEGGVYSSNYGTAEGINQLEIKTLLNYHSLAQIVKAPTRAQKILDMFITNVFNYWKKAKAVKGHLH